MMASISPIRLKLEKNDENHKGDTAFQWSDDQRKYWIVAMFCGTVLLYATRSAVPLCMASMSSEMNWDKETDVRVYLASLDAALDFNESFSTGQGISLTLGYVFSFFAQKLFKLIQV